MRQLRERWALEDLGVEEVLERRDLDLNLELGLGMLRRRGS
jgi:hypothetical protein